MPGQKPWNSSGPSRRSSARVAALEAVIRKHPAARSRSPSTGSLVLTASRDLILTAVQQSRRSLGQQFRSDRGQQSRRGRGRQLNPGRDARGVGGGREQLFNASGGQRQHDLRRRSPSNVSTGGAMTVITAGHALSVDEPERHGDLRRIGCGHGPRQRHDKRRQEHDHRCGAIELHPPRQGHHRRLGQQRHLDQSVGQPSHAQGPEDSFPHSGGRWRRRFASRYSKQLAGCEGLRRPCV